MFFLFSFILAVVKCSGWEVENCSMESVTFSTNFPTFSLPFNFTEPFTCIELDESTGAKSLDGSNYKFYFNPGRDNDTDKFMIYWQGGAFCGSDGDPVLESCYSKLDTMFGSNKYWIANGTSYMEMNGWGMFSSLEEFNPLFAKWNKVRILPLDGANYQGSLKDPLVYNGTEMWFRGFNNTMATLEYVKEHYGLFNATEIILCGGSAGAIAAMVWTSYLKDYFPSNIKLTLVLDGGLFLDSYSPSSNCYLFRFMIQQLVETIQLNNTDLYRSCRHKDTALWKCLMTQYIYEDIDIPVYFSNSQTDTFELTNLMGITCLLDGGPDMCDTADKAAITHVREDFLKYVLKIRKAKPNWGFWLRSCFEHSLQFYWGWYGHSMDVFNAETQRSDNIQNTLYRWYLGEEDHVAYIDLIDWLHNPECTYLYE